MELMEEGIGGRRAHPASPPLTLRPAKLLSQQIADLRGEVETIQELNAIFRHQKGRGYQDHVANDRRKIRLEEIIQQLAALRCKGRF
jgi:hypothetical protein